MNKKEQIYENVNNWVETGADCETIKNSLMQECNALDDNAKLDYITNVLGAVKLKIQQIKNNQNNN